MQLQRVETTLPTWGNVLRTVSNTKSLLEKMRNAHKQKAAFSTAEMEQLKNINSFLLKLKSNLEQGYATGKLNGSAAQEAIDAANELEKQIR